LVLVGASSLFCSLALLIESTSIFLFAPFLLCPQTLLLLLAIALRNIGIPPLLVSLPPLLILALTPLFPLTLLFGALLILALPLGLALLFALPALLVLSLAFIVAPLLFGLATLLRIVVLAPPIFLLIVLFLFFPAFAAVPFAAVVLAKSDRRRSHPEQDS
jgi:hypothetical protein